MLVRNPFCDWHLLFGRPSNCLCNKLTVYLTNSVSNNFHDAVARPLSSFATLVIFRMAVRYRENARIFKLIVQMPRMTLAPILLSFLKK